MVIALEIEEIGIRPIGIIHSPYKQSPGTPIQPESGRDVEARVELLPEFTPGLRDLEGFSHIILLYLFHRSGETRLVVKPFLDDAERGVFSTRAPVRPNHIGMSVVRLERIEGNILYIKDLDIVDGTPLLDIKPHIPRIDCPGATRTGWLQGRDEGFKRSRDDGHFQT
jgi:tRNA-Thr(GGU) m(6)t(6)A37 methyltransferase TsaA